jgi:hypothetical protein
MEPLYVKLTSKPFETFANADQLAKLQRQHKPFSISAG